MLMSISTNRRLRAALLVILAIVVAGCSKSPGGGLFGRDGNGANGENGLNSGGAAPGTQQDFVVNVGDRVFFETDSTILTFKARGILDKQAVWLNKYGSHSVVIEGHADERGTREYNIALGARRATATRNYLASRGVAAARVTTLSYGKERPVAVCNDISCWSQNRRAVTLLR
jgi:peptidoglycan-associated lipoprotein